MLAANCPPRTAQPLAHAFSLSVSDLCRIGRCSPWATPFPPPPPPKVAPLCSAASSVLLRGPTPPERSYPPCGFRLRGPVSTQSRSCCVVRLLQNVHICRAAFAFADRSRPSWGRDALEVSRFSCTKLPGVSGVYDYAGLTADSRLAPSVMLPSAKSTASAS